MTQIANTLGICDERKSIPVSISSTMTYFRQNEDRNLSGESERFMIKVFLSSFFVGVVVVEIGRCALLQNVQTHIFILKKRDKMLLSFFVVDKKYIQRFQSNLTLVVQIDMSTLPQCHNVEIKCCNCLSKLKTQSINYATF